MDCLKSFVIASNLNQSFALGPNLDVWTIGTQNYWFGRTTTAIASFNVQGFKNINIYGVDLIGDFRSGPGGSNCIIEDWRVNVDLLGQAPLLGGQVVPFTNSLNINVDPAFTNTFQLSRYKPTVMFKSPIQSVKEIRFQAYSANGYANQSLTNVTVNWNLKYVFYYEFEGE